MAAPTGAPALQRALLAWWPGHGRDLPWRRTRDPWAVLVSELMLQQTQVCRVVPAYAALLDRFPSPAACAAALRRGPVPLADAGPAAGWPGDPERARRAAAALVTDGLAVVDDGVLRLP